MTCSICPASARTGHRFGAGHHHQVDVLADHAGQHLEVLGDDAVQVDDPGSEHLLAAEGQQLAGQRRSAFGGAGDFLGRAAQLRLGAQTFQQELRVARNHHQQIVEVMRDAARQTSDGFHLLRLAKLLFEGAALGTSSANSSNTTPPSRPLETERPETRTTVVRAIFAFPFRGQSFEGLGGAQKVGELEPLVVVGVEAEDVLADQFSAERHSPAFRGTPDWRRESCRWSRSGKCHRERWSPASGSSAPTAAGLPAPRARPRSASRSAWP